MLVRCVCGFHRLNPAHATYVRDGVPFCHEWTCRQARLLRKQERDLKRVPFSDEEKDDVDTTHR